MGEVTNITVYKRALALVWLASLPGYATAQTVVSAGPASFRFETTATAIYLSNPYYLDGAFDEFLPIEETFGWEISPTALMRIGNEEARLSFDGALGLNLRRMESASELDGEDLFARLNGHYSTSKLEWDFDANWTEFSLPERLARHQMDAPRGTQTLLSLDGSYLYSQRLRFNSGITYSDKSYDDGLSYNYTDHSSVSIPVRAYYRITEKIELGGGVRFRDREREGLSSNRQDLAWHLAAKGQLTSKVEIDLKAGVLRPTDNDGIEIVGIERDDNPFLSARASWQTTPDTSLNLLGTSDTYSTGLGNTARKDQLSLVANWQINERYATQARIAFGREEFDLNDRRDKVRAVSISLSSAPSLRLITALSAHYDENDSNLPGLHYQATSIRWTQGWRF